MSPNDVASGQFRGVIIVRLSHHRIASVGAAVVAGLLSLSVAKAESAPDNTSSRNWDEVFAQVPPDKTSISRQTDWLDDSALAYAKSARSDAAAVRWLPQPLPAVDGINAKIDGFGGGGNHTNGFDGTSGSLSVPLAQQWGLQIDGGVGSDKGIGAYGGAGHLFWRDPSSGLLGAYGSYSHWNGIETATFGHISANTGRFAAEGEYYWSRWTLSGLVGVETVSVNAAVVSQGCPHFPFPTASSTQFRRPIMSPIISSSQPVISTHSTLTS